MRTLESFLSQFPVKVKLNYAVKCCLQYEPNEGGFPVFRYLERLFVLKDDGNYYGAY